MKIIIFNGWSSGPFIKRDPVSLGFRHLLQAGIVLSLLLLFHTASIAEENVVEHESGFYYTIKKGDTLWDLSERFSDSPWLWPDLWKKNSQIANPHWIYPGERIRLYRRAGVKELVREVEKAVPAPVEPEKEPPYFYYSAMDSVSFVKKTAIQSSGKIIKAQGSKNFLATGDQLIIAAENDSDFTQGRRYSAFRTMNPLRKHKGENNYGVQHYPTGVVEVTSKEAGFVQARIVRSYNTMEIGDLLTPYEKRSNKIILTASKEGLEGKIFAAQEGENLLGGKSLAFIDKGENDGVMPGQAYTLYYHEKKSLQPKKKWKKTLLSTVEIGSFIVLRTEPENATIMILDAEESIELGTAFRSPSP